MMQAMPSTLAGVGAGPMPVPSSTPSARAGAGRRGDSALLDAVLSGPAAGHAQSVRRAPRAPSADAGTASLTDIRDSLREALMMAYPDIREHASQNLEAEIQRRHHIRINANQTYFNTFTRAQRSDRAHTGWSHQVRPLQSYSLTDMQLHDFALASTTNDAESGVYREGLWATEFSHCNEVPLNAAELKDLIRRSGFQQSYRNRLDSFWARNMEGMQTLAEADVLLYAEAHQRADNRALALGLDVELAARLELGDFALAMLAAASGRPDPDFGSLGVQVLAFDINGYPAEDMAWLRAATGQVLLVMPGNERHLRFYPNLAAMRTDIAAMAANVLGRRELASHFSAYHRRDGMFYQGVDSWLMDIGDGGYDTRIAYDRQAFAGHLPTLAGLPETPGQAPSLLSNKALAMLCEAAGYPDPVLGAFGTEAFVFDIDSYPSKDMSWLRASDGHVVLLIPGNRRPVREYRDVDQMRADIRRMAATPRGRAALAAHFTLYNRRDGRTYQGVEKWLLDIRGGSYDNRIAYEPAAIRGSVFRSQLLRTRDARLERLDDLAKGRARSTGERMRWLQSFGAFAPIQAGMAETTELTDDAGAIRRKRPSWSDLVRAVTSRRRLWRWDTVLRERVINAVGRLSAWLLDVQLRRASGVPPPSPTPVTDVDVLCALAPSRQRNAQGFFERDDFEVLYRIEPVIPGRRAEISGLLPDANFIVNNALGGTVVGAFLTPEAALEWWWGEQANLPFRMYQIDARGLRGVSFGDNRANDPSYRQHLDSWIEETAGGRNNLHWFYLRQRMADLEEGMVHLNLDGFDSDRIQTVRGVGDEPPARHENANPLQMYDIGNWFYDANRDLWEFNLESERSA